MDRRDFLDRAAALAAASLFAPIGAGAATDAAPRSHAEAMAASDIDTGRHAVVGLLVYPGMFPLDLVGPLAVFESLMHKDIHLVWKDTAQLGSKHVPIRPTTTFADCPKDLDVLFVPGGVPGTFDVMRDDTVLDFLAERGKTARWVTSVCTGSLILGAAGLLEGYKATSYWSLCDVLALLGAVPTPGRVVVDRNRITGGGVTAGLDFGLAIAAKLTSPEYAQAIQLYLEYDPQPPFDAGSPATASARVTRYLQGMFAGVDRDAREAASAATKRRGR